MSIDNAPLSHGSDNAPLDKAKDVCYYILFYNNKETEKRMNALLECPILKFAINHDVNPGKEDCIIQLSDDFLTKNADNLWVVLSGDWGGQIYLTFPVAMLPKNRSRAENVISSLLKEIDNKEWGCNDADGRSVEVVYTKHPERGVIGGMGGGHLRKGEVWFHPEIDAKWKTRVSELFAK